MITNTDITVYNKYYDTSTKKHVFLRTLVLDVQYEDKKEVKTLGKGGKISDDKVIIIVPLSSGANYLKPKVWQALVDKSCYWTLQTGDHIVKGDVPEEITDLFTPTNLRAEYDDFSTISGVDTFDKGSELVQHWKVFAK